MLRTALLLAITLIVSINCHAQTNSDDEDYQAKLEELKHIIDKVKEEIGQVRNSKDKLVNELESNEKNIGDLTQKVGTIEKELDTQKKQLALLHKQRNQMNKEKTKQALHIQQHIVSAYKLGNQSRLKTLLNQEDLELSSRMVKYHQLIVEARSEKIAQYQETLASLAKLNIDISVKNASYTQQKKNLETERDALKSANGKRKNTLARLDKQLKQQGKHLGSLTQEQKQLEQLIEEVAQVIANIPTPEDHNPFDQQRGKLRWPVKGKIKHRFATAKAGGRLTWDGVLISAKQKSEISAIHGGRVVFSDWLKGQGLLIIIDHGGGYLSLYGHNESLYKEVGDWVNKNELIALTGNTGGRAEPGLYFEIRENGKPLNPAKWCRS